MPPVEMAAPRPDEFRVHTASRDGSVVVSLTGELDISTSPELSQALESAQSDPTRAVVVDLAGLQFIDSTGLRVLLGAKRDADRAGAELRVRNPRTEVRRLLEIAGVLELLSADCH